LPPKLDGRFQLLEKKALVDRLVGGPTVEPHTDSALAVKKSVGDEFSLVIDQFDRLAIQIEQVLVFDARRLNAIHSRSEYPRVPAIKRQRLARLQDDASRGVRWRDW